MPFSINEFKAQGSRSGFTRPAFFLLQVLTPPEFWQGQDTRFLSFLCSSASLPGVAIEATSAKRIGYGPSKKIPHDLVHSDISLTIFSDGAGMAIDFFDQWNRNIVSFGDPLNPVQGASYGEVQYPDHYETQLNLLYYNENPGSFGTELFNYSITEAYPTGMAEIPVNWAQGEEISIIQVPLTYRTYQIQKNQVSAFGTGGESILLDASYLLNVSAGFSGKFGSINASVLAGLGQAESFTGGTIGISGGLTNFSAAVNAITGSSSSLTNSLGIVGSLNSSFSI